MAEGLVVNIVATSDWHGSLPGAGWPGDEEWLPAGDVLCVAGDLLPVWNHSRQFQSEWTKDTLIPYLGELPFDHVLFIGGNHDFLFQDSKKFAKLLPEHVHYLEDETIEIDGIVFHGSPWSPTFGNWAFMLPDTDIGLGMKWNIIPDNTDVLIVHGPPHGLGDFAAYSQAHTGSKLLVDRLSELAVRHVLTGHIHEAAGSYDAGSYEVHNVSLLDLSYDLRNKPIVLTLAPVVAAL